MKTAKDGILHEIDIQTYQAQKCFFCDNYMLPKNALIERNDRIEWREKYGCYKHHSGNVGTKQICDECLSDLVDLVCTD